MSNKRDLSYDMRCRICLQNVSQKKLLSLFLPNENINKTLLTNADLIMACCSVQIVKNDRFPQNICESCCKDLSRAYNFKILCEKSDNILHNEVEGTEIVLIKSELKVEKDDDSRSNNDELENAVDDFSDFISNIKQEYTCDCLTTFTDELLYLSHMKDHCVLRKKNEGKIKLDKNETFDDKKRKGDQICPTCGKIFSKRFNLIKHIRTRVCKDVKKYLCSVCGRGFKDSRNMEVHMRTHSGEKPYVCQICNKCFAQWSTLESHKVTHTKEKNHACEICGKSFTIRNSLRKHLQLHTDERKFVCDICNKTFKTARYLKEHKIYHSGLKNIKCEVCEKTFFFRKSLVVHRRTHTGDRPFICEICSQAFTQRHCLRSHMASHHKTETRINT